MENWGFCFEVVPKCGMLLLCGPCLEAVPKYGIETLDLEVILGYKVLGLFPEMVPRHGTEVDVCVEVVPKRVAEQSGLCLQAVPECGSCCRGGSAELACRPPASGHYPSASW